MRPVTVLFALCAFVSSAFAGINEGGVLVVHHDPQLVYSASCGDLTLPGDCSQLNPTAAADGTPQKWFVIAAFPDDVSDRLNTFTFGLGQYDPENLAMGSWGPCDIIGSPLEVATANWPDPGEGTAVSWAPDCLGGEMVPVYWFLTYAYSNGTIPLTAHSVQGGAFVDCTQTAGTDAIMDYGVMGFGVAGNNPCPGGLDGGGDDEEPWADGGEEDAPEDPVATSDVLSIRFSTSVQPQHPTFYTGNSIPIEEVDFRNSNIRRALANHGALTLMKTFPQSSPSDTTGVGINGKRVQLIDLSGYFQVTFPGIEEATGALRALKRVPGIRSIGSVGNRGLKLQSIPNDEYFDSWRYISDDAQWNLKNEGLRTDEVCCQQALSEYDLDLDALQYWYEGVGDPDIVIAVADVGIFDNWVGHDPIGHEDLRSINSQLPDPELFSRFHYYDIDFCGDHGTKMAGLAAALTNNEIGVAGICPDCSILDIAIPHCSYWDCVDYQDGLLVEGCGYVTDMYRTYVNNLVTETLNGHIPGRTVALNCSFGDVGLEDHLEDSIFAFWNALQIGIVTAASSAGHEYPTPAVGYPCAFPFVVGVAGYTWLGQFWEEDNTCYTAESTGLCPDTTLNLAGPGNVKICAPSSGRAVTTHPLLVELPEEGYADYYFSTGIGSSGAAGQASGAIGLLQAIHHAERGYYIEAEDVIGLLEGTALPFSEDPWDPDTYSRVCETCEAEDYGKGRLNVGGAVESALDYIWHETVFTADDMYSILPVRSFTIGDTEWLQWLASAYFWVPVLQNPSPEHSPDRVAWVRRVSSNTFPTFEDDEILVAMVEEGIHDCSMTTINQETGESLVSGYLYGYYEGENFIWVGTSLDDLEIHVVYLTGPTSGVSDGGNLATSAISIAPFSNPIRPHSNLRFSIESAGHVEISLIDVTGRIIRRLVDGHKAPGAFDIMWDGMDDSDHMLSSGVYWLTASTDIKSESRRLVLIR
ncbi:MAG: S8 family serine peptidase [Candidatus Eisenbacteria bacterium]|uniref:S8 family serine peptidase n=1 Tax=Eiseniibacteriota bacterium TaxID=2212470 RepID=A0A948RXD6_UNCEI|nr:S8 family serine peptidase [Candidatus Eisenbacteria bacterium]MBU1951169.1 S8 family serine peptidase [Candidatus Eisenbacteria bacterium]MBU2691711.1 S8 family serine peptidase [Candidatus Eisenbacteria bacterium]